MQSLIASLIEQKEERGANEMAAFAQLTPRQKQAALADKMQRMGVQVSGAEPSLTAAKPVTDAEWQLAVQAAADVLRTVIGEQQPQQRALTLLQMHLRTLVDLGMQIHETSRDTAALTVVNVVLGAAFGVAPDGDKPGVTRMRAWLQQLALAKHVVAPARSTSS